MALEELTRVTPKHREPDHKEPNQTAGTGPKHREENNPQAPVRRFRLRTRTLYAVVLIISLLAGYLVSATVNNFIGTTTLSMPAPSSTLFAQSNWLASPPATPVAATAAAPRTTTPATRRKTPPAKQLPTTYRVRPGNTLNSVAARHHLSLSSLLAMNPRICNANVIRIGQVITLRGKKHAQRARICGVASATSRTLSRPALRPPASAKTPAPKAKKPARKRHQSASHSSSAGARAARFALSKVGYRYVWGATGPKAFDCSGLTLRAWQHAGVRIPRNSRAQYRATKHISLSQLRPGDLVFYPRGGHRIGHVAIYIGNGKVVSARNKRAGVRITGLHYMKVVGASRPGS